VIGHIDSILTAPNESAKDALKNKFMLGDLRDDDFAAYVPYCQAKSYDLVLTVFNRAIMAGPFTGQTTSWEYAGAIYEFCDYIEVCVSSKHIL
jgi:hypothetical protein